MPEGGCDDVTFLPTNRTGIKGVTYPGEVFFLSHSLSHILSRVKTHSLSYIEASTSKTLATRCNVK
jgi:hypothetical protein